ncbi:hypothetical protein CLOP_g2097, partial [Closterium sp. NIES-67]
MVHLTELRIVLPFTLEEFKRGQRYANWKTNEDATEPGQGGTLLSSAPYYHEQHGEGLFTHSLFRLGNRLPDWSWINYPYFRTIITIPFFSKVRVVSTIMTIITIITSSTIRTMRTTISTIMHPNSPSSQSIHS